MDHFLSLADLTPDELRGLLTLAVELKEEWRASGNRPLLKSKTLGMLFQKPSLRTRISFEMGMIHLGGQALYLSPFEIQLGKRESVPDVARVLSRYVDGIVARTFSHGTVVALAQHATIPIINGLSDAEHPCQALADLVTIQERKGRLKGLTFAYVGDANNVATSLLLGCAMTGMEFRFAAPKRYQPADELLAAARTHGGTVTVTESPDAAVEGADVVYTDVWTSMGQEEEAPQRRRAFSGYQVDSRLLSLAKRDALFMHPLPAHQGEEVAESVLDAPQSVVFDQAENRVYAQEAILVQLLGTR